MREYWLLSETIFGSRGVFGNYFRGSGYWGTAQNDNQPENRDDNSSRLSLYGHSRLASDKA